MLRWGALFGFMIACVGSLFAQINDAPAQVLQITPPNNATGIPINTEIIILFSEEMSPPRQGYSEGDPPLSPLYQQGSQVPVPGTLEPIGKANHWRFRPAQPLRYTTQYEIRLNGWLTYRYDQKQEPIGLAPGQQLFRFTTEPEPDRTPPRVVRFNPANGQTNVPINQEIEIEFSEPMPPFDRYERRHTTVLYLSGQPIHGTLTPNQNRAVWRFRPQQPLRYGMVYTIDVSEWMDDAGNSIQPPQVPSSPPNPNPTERLRE